MAKLPNPSYDYPSPAGVREHLLPVHTLPWPYIFLMESVIMKHPSHVFDLSKLEEMK